MYNNPVYDRLLLLPVQHADPQAHEEQQGEHAQSQQPEHGMQQQQQRRRRQRPADQQQQAKSTRVPGAPPPTAWTDHVHRVGHSMGREGILASALQAAAALSDTRRHATAADRRMAGRAAAASTDQRTAKRVNERSAEADVHAVTHGLARLGELRDAYDAAARMLRRRAPLWGGIDQRAEAVVGGEQSSTEREQGQDVDDQEGLGPQQQQVSEPAHGGEEHVCSSYFVSHATDLDSLLAHGKALLEEAAASPGSKDLIDISSDGEPPPPPPARPPPPVTDPAQEERERRLRASRERRRQEGYRRLSVQADAGRPGSAAWLRQRTPGGAYPLPAIGGQDQLQRPDVPYSRYVRRALAPDLYGTGSPEKVRQALSRSPSPPVHHTPKSQLAEDATRYHHHLRSRSAGEQGVFEHSRQLGSHVRWPWGGPSTAAAEVEVRERQGLPVHPDIRRASLERPPWIRQVTSARSSSAAQASEAARTPRARVWGSRHVGQLDESGPFRPVRTPLRSPGGRASPQPRPTAEQQEQQQERTGKEVTGEAVQHGAGADSDPDAETPKDQKQSDWDSYGGSQHESAAGSHLDERRGALVSLAQRRPATSRGPRLSGHSPLAPRPASSSAAFASQHQNLRPGSSATAEVAPAAAQRVPNSPGIGIVPSGAPPAPIERLIGSASASASPPQHQHTQAPAHARRRAMSRHEPGVAVDTSTADMAKAALRMLSCATRVPDPVTGPYVFSTQAADRLWSRGPDGELTRSAAMGKGERHSSGPAGTLQYVGRRPPFSLRPQDLPYPLPGYPKQIADGPMTKAHAQELAWSQLDLARDNTYLHRSAGLGNPGPAAELRLRTLHPTATGGARRRRGREHWGMQESAAGGAVAQAHGALPPAVPDRHQGQGQPQGLSPAPKGVSWQQVQGAAEEAVAAFPPRPNAFAMGSQAHLRPYSPSDSRSSPPYPQQQQPQPAHDVDAPPDEDDVSVRAYVNARNAAGETALHRAAGCRQEGTQAVLEHLVALGADVNAHDCLGLTPLMTVLVKGCAMPEMAHRVSLLLAAGANVNLRDKMGETVLHKVVMYGQCAVTSRQCPSETGSLHWRVAGPALSPLPGAAAQQLSTSIDSRSWWPPGMVRYKHGHRVWAPGVALVELVNMLVEKGLEVNVRNTLGQTALHLCALKPHRHGPTMSNCSLEVLLKAGCDPNAQDLAGHTPLHCVLMDEVQAWGLQEADQINHFKQASSRTKLHPRCRCTQPFCQEHNDIDGGSWDVCGCSAARSLLWVVKLLLRFGAKPSIPDEAGITPLHLAVAALSVPLTSVLLKCGADPMAKDVKGRSPAGLVHSLAVSLRTAALASQAQELQRLLERHVPGGHLPEEPGSATLLRVPLPPSLFRPGWRQQGPFVSGAPPPAPPPAATPAAPKLAPTATALAGSPYLDRVADIVQQALPVAGSVAANVPAVGPGSSQQQQHKQGLHVQAQQPMSTQQQQQVPDPHMQPANPLHQELHPPVASGEPVAGARPEGGAGPREHEAATRIQAVARGRASRKEVAEMRQRERERKERERRRQEEAARERESREREEAERREREADADAELQRQALLEQLHELGAVDPEDGLEDMAQMFERQHSATRGLRGSRRGAKARSAAEAAPGAGEGGESGGAEGEAAGEEGVAATKVAVAGGEEGGGGEDEGGEGEEEEEEGSLAASEQSLEIREPSERGGGRGPHGGLLGALGLQGAESMDSDELVAQMMQQGFDGGDGDKDGEIGSGHGQLQPEEDDDVF